MQALLCVFALQSLVCLVHWGENVALKAGSTNTKCGDTVLVHMRGHVRINTQGREAGRAVEQGDGVHSGSFCWSRDAFLRSLVHHSDGQSMGAMASSLCRALAGGQALSPGPDTAEKRHDAS